MPWRQTKRVVFTSLLVSICVWWTSTTLHEQEYRRQGYQVAAYIAVVPDRTTNDGARRRTRMIRRSWSSRSGIRIDGHDTDDDVHPALADDESGVVVVLPPPRPEATTTRTATTSTIPTPLSRDELQRRVVSLLTILDERKEEEPGAVMMATGTATADEGTTSAPALSTTTTTRSYSRRKGNDNNSDKTNNDLPSKRIIPNGELWIGITASSSSPEPPTIITSGADDGVIPSTFLSVVVQEPKTSSSASSGVMTNHRGPTTTGTGTEVTLAEDHIAARTIASTTTKPGEGSTRKKRSYSRRKKEDQQQDSSTGEIVPAVAAAAIPSDPSSTPEAAATAANNDEIGSSSEQHAIPTTSKRSTMNHNDDTKNVVESIIINNKKSYTRRKIVDESRHPGENKNGTVDNTNYKQQKSRDVIVPSATHHIRTAIPSTIASSSSSSSMIVTKSYTRRRKQAMPITREGVMGTNNQCETDVVATTIREVAAVTTTPPNKTDDVANAKSSSTIDHCDTVGAVSLMKTTSTTNRKDHDFSGLPKSTVAATSANDAEELAATTIKAVSTPPAPTREQTNRPRVSNTNFKTQSSLDGDTALPNDDKPPTDQSSNLRVASNPAAVRRYPLKEKKTKWWCASYRVSIVTQDQIKEYAQRHNSAVQILQYFASLDPRQCNAANVVCAVTLAAKALSRQKTHPSKTGEVSTASNQLRTSLSMVLAVIEELLDKQQQHTFSARQLSNLAWGLAKFYDYDDTLQPLNPWNVVSYDGNVVESWDVGSSSIHHDRTTTSEDGTIAVSFSNVVDSIGIALTKAVRESPDTVKTQELCMSCWAYGVLRRRRRPTGWQTEPMVGTMSFSTNARGDRNDDIVDFFGFDVDDEGSAGVGRPAVLAPVDALLGEIALALCTAPGRIQSLQWKELANVAWAYATIGRSITDAPLTLLNGLSKEATDRLTNDTARDMVQSRDLAQMVWSLGVLQSDNYRLADRFVLFVDAVAERIAHRKGIQDISQWSCADIVQTALSLAHARLDEQALLLPLYKEATARAHRPTGEDSGTQVERQSFYDWELSVLLWIQARLYLTEQLAEEYPAFTATAMKAFSDRIDKGQTLAKAGIGSQERANIVWSIAVLNCWQDLSIQNVVVQIYAEACAECQQQNGIQLDHAHQLWQALTLLEPHCPHCFANVPSWFRSYLDHQWKAEKARPKKSSARHKALSKTLDLMGVAHVNEHDEDIDVAIVLKPMASWTHETVRSEMPQGVKVAVEFDGPVHFTRQRPGTVGPPRTLGHTVLKYRLLKQFGWTVVRVPYYEFDRIPFWASMERQRYVQRLLKTHGNLRFSHVDVSEYKSHVVPNRSSRFD